MFEQCVSMGDKYVGTVMDNNTIYLYHPHLQREITCSLPSRFTHLLLRAVSPWDSIFGTVHEFSYSSNISDSGSAATNPHRSVWLQRPKGKEDRKYIVLVYGNSTRSFMDYRMFVYKWYGRAVPSTPNAIAHCLAIIIELVSLPYLSQIPTIKTSSVCGRPYRLHTYIHTYIHWSFTITTRVFVAAVVITIVAAVDHHPVIFRLLNDTRMCLSIALTMALVDLL